MTMTIENRVAAEPPSSESTPKDHGRFINLAKKAIPRVDADAMKKLKEAARDTAITRRHYPIIRD